MGSARGGIPHPARQGRREARRAPTSRSSPTAAPSLTALKAAELLAAEHDINAEVIDLRSIRPLDEEAILASVRKTHRAIYVEENKPFCGVGAQIGSLLMEKAFDDLDAPVLRVTSLDAPAIYARKSSRASSRVRPTSSRRC